MVGSAGSLDDEASIVAKDSLVNTQVGVSEIVLGLFNAGAGIFLDTTAGSLNAEVSLVDIRVGVSGIVSGLFIA